jgi:hypothetical protein
MAKKRGNNKQAWLDWLADEPPAADAQAQLRERFKQQANSYQPLNRTAAPPAQHQAQPQHTPVAPVAAPQTPQQAQPVSRTPQVLHQPQAAQKPAKPAAPATVSIQIHIPAFHGERFKKLAAKFKQVKTQVKHWYTVAEAWLLDQYQRERKRTIGITVGSVVVLLLLIVPPLFLLNGNDKTANGSSTGTSAGGVKQEKPSYDPVRPSNKPKLGTPDGVRAAYDSTRKSYTYSDSIAGNGFTVSEQPLPAQFKDGDDAVERVAPTLNKGVTPVKLKSLTGSAYVSTNAKYNSQTVVTSIRSLLIFIQSSHAFKNSEWEAYLNTLQ